VWSVSFSPERRPGVSGSCGPLVLGGDLLGIAGPQAPLPAGGRLQLNWTTVLRTPLNVTLGVAGLGALPVLALPSGAGNLSAPLPANITLGGPCDNTGAPQPATAAFVSTLDASITATVPFAVALAPSVAVSLTGPASNLLTPGTAWVGSWSACGGRPPQLGRPARASGH
jgi:hypothetical protein